jgi:3-dehydrosphinganine reductase
MNYSGRNTIITGGSSGIGLALARLLTQQGANVCILARDTGKLNSALEALENQRQNPAQKLAAFPVDAVDADRVEGIIRDLVESDGAPDLVINSAGDVEVGYAYQLTPADYQRNMNNNYLSSVNVTHAVLPSMSAKGSGYLVYISSVLGRVGAIGYSAYGPSKAALDIFAEAIRMEVKPCGIHIATVYPSDTDTPQYAYESAHLPGEIKYLKTIFESRLNTPEEVAGAILRGVTQNRKIIFPDRDGKIMDFLVRILGRGAANVLEFLLNIGYRRKTGNKDVTACQPLDGD